jgi:hypothetical protein
MGALYYERKTCRMCLSEDLQMAMPLKPTPIGDKYLPPERGEESRELVPLDLLLCGQCGNMQTGAIIDPDVIYGHYLSRPSAVNPALSGAYKEYAESVVERYELSKDDLVVEMGSNDGAFLNFYKRLGIPILGIDPAQNLAAAAAKIGVETIATFFTEKVGGEIREKHGPASVFIANFVFANIDDLDDVVLGIRTLLAEDGVFICETNYRVDVFQKFLIETINHEHLTYYAVKSLQKYFARHAMELINVEHVPSKGGSLRFTVQHQGGPRAVDPSVQGHIDNEEALGLYDLGFYQAHIDKIESVKNELGQRLEEFKVQGKTFAGYGTSIGATILIYQLGFGEYLKFLVDDDPYRQGLVSPGFHIPVVSAQGLADEDPGYVLILAPLYAEPIMNKNQDYIDRAGHFINVWPEVKIY